MRPMRNFDEAQKEWLEEDPTTPDAVAANPATEQARDALASKMLDEGRRLTIRLNRVKTLYAKLQDLDSKGATLDDIRLLEGEYNNQTASPPPVAAGPRMPLTGVRISSWWRRMWHDLLSADEPRNSRPISTSTGKDLP